MTDQSVVMVLTNEQRRLVQAVLDQIVPARPGLAGAGQLGLGAALERAAQRDPHSRRRLLDGLSAIERAAEAHGGALFAELTPASQLAVLQQVEASQPAFFSWLVEQTYRAYYGRPDVQAAVGHDSRPLQPRGNTLPAFDLAILDRQRQRAPFWRRA